METTESALDQHPGTAKVLAQTVHDAIELGRAELNLAKEIADFFRRGVRRVRAVHDVEVAIRAVRDRVVIEPDVVRLLDGHRVLRRLAKDPDMDVRSHVAKLR